MIRQETLKILTKLMIESGEARLKMINHGAEAALVALEISTLVVDAAEAIEIVYRNPFLARVSSSSEFDMDGESDEDRAIRIEEENGERMAEREREPKE